MSDTDRLPSRLAANMYLVAGIVILILTSRPYATAVTRCAISISVEIALVVLAFVFMWLERLPIRDTAQLRRPETRTFWLALAAVPGLWAIGITLNLVSMLLLGYSPAVTPAEYPANGLEAILLALTIVVVAPICEELTFRGYVQRAYEARHRRTGVLVGGIIFAAYHLRFFGLLGLIPIALSLGLIAWRTESVYPGIVVHAGFNAIAMLLTTSMSFLPRWTAVTIGTIVLCLGALMTPFSLAALWVLWRTTAPETETAGAVAPRGIFKKWAWIAPIVALLGVYGYVATQEFRLNRHPETMLDYALTLEADDAWAVPVTWHYSVRDRLGHEQGQAVCTRAPSSQGIILDCHASYAGFDLTARVPELLRDLNGLLPKWPPQLSGILNTALQVEPTNWTITTTWSRPSLQVTTLIAHEEQGGDQYNLEYTTSGTGAILSHGRAGESPTLIDTPMQAGLLMPHEWAWRCSGLMFQLPYGSHVMLTREDGQEGITSVRGFLQVVGGEPVRTPAGNYVTWKVVLSWHEATGHESTESAWYDVQAPHTLVRYDDGSVSYVLTKVEAPDQQAAGEAYDLLR